MTGPTQPSDFNESTIRWDIHDSSRRGSDATFVTSPPRDGEETAVNSPSSTPAVTRRNSVVTICKLDTVDEHDQQKVSHKSSWLSSDQKSSSEKSSPHSSGKEDAVSDSASPAAEEKDESPAEPSHGRLLPLGKFLTCYFCLALAILLTSLDQTIAACITPTISTEFGSSSQSSWIGTAFLLTSTVFQPLYGRFCDVFGRKMLFIVAQALFLGGTALCGAAPSMTALIIGRAIAGIGGAGLLSVTQIMISDIVTLKKRGMYHGILSSVNGAGSVIGPLAGGVFASKISWRWAFYFQLPIVAFTMICTILVLPQVGRSDVGKFKEKFRTIDWVGIVLFLSGFTFLLLAISLIAPPDRPFTSPLVSGFFFPALALIASFVVWELKYAKNPVVPFKVFKAPPILAILSFNFTFGWIFYAGLYFLPVFFQVADRQDAVKSSVSLFPLVLTSIAFSWLSGLITSVSGNYAGTFFLGLLLTSLGSILIFTLYHSGMSQGVQIATMIILGTGFGMQMQNSLVAAQAATRQKDVAMTTAVRNFMRSIGGVLGIALSNCILYTTLPTYLRSTLSDTFPEKLVTKIIDAPLEIYELPAEFAGDVPAVINSYVRSLKIVYLVFIPISVFSLLLWFAVPEYELTRGKDGEPIRRAHRTINVFWQVRRLASWIRTKRGCSGEGEGKEVEAGSIGVLEGRRGSAGSDATLDLDLEKGSKQAQDRP
ncbi:hypothetical protein CF327_g2917 [Tilletia walkeri]|uniref:Major facilitator superfamily (MFS) profile domain-containing protein n=1 Tax=Tilletia walkeri TaxID=117179 RepID=A0A8X7NC92_9BASI|nr:hypothetical protein CF327_g2917 [Tilletia walkeri]KAE8271261.1 hypothetical protein A4X09_0g1093 [Tilletia walkeri]